MKKIAFYSSGGNGKNSLYAPDYCFFPSRAEEWDALAKHYPDCSFSVYVCLPGGHIVDVEGAKIRKRPKLVNIEVLPEEWSVERIAEAIAADGIHTAVAFTLPDIPYDWNPVRDAMVGQELEKRGVEVFCHRLETALAAFDKHETAALLAKHGFKTARGVFVHRGLFDVMKRDQGIQVNIYREFVLHEIRSLHFPVVIKSSSGAGSVGMQVVESFEEAHRFLVSEQSDTDLMVEEWLSGDNFGAEVYGAPGDYHVIPPILFSLNDAGVTDPFASVKFGPVIGEEYRVKELMEELKRMAEALQFVGNVQVDLVFHEGEWFIIEINPRYSLMSQATAAMEGRGVLSAPAEMAIGLPTKPYPLSEPLFAVDFKTKLLDDQTVEHLRAEFPAIRSVMRFRLRKSKTEAVGYCEFVVSGFYRKEELLKELVRMHGAYPELVSETVLKHVTELMKKG